MKIFNVIQVIKNNELNQCYSRLQSLLFDIMNPSMRPENKDGNESMGDMESVQQQLKCCKNDNDLITTTSPRTSSNTTKKKICLQIYKQFLGFEYSFKWFWTHKPKVNTPIYGVQTCHDAQKNVY